MTIFRLHFRPPLKCLGILPILHNLTTQYSLQDYLQLLQDNYYARYYTIFSVLGKGGPTTSLLWLHRHSGQSHTRMACDIVFMQKQWKNRNS